MPKVVTQKFNITLVNPQTGEETSTISTEEVGGVSIEQSMGPIWNELGLELVSKELLEAIEEQKVSPDEDGVVPDQSPDQVQRRVIKAPQQQQQFGAPQQQFGAPQQYGNIPMSINIPEKIIQHGNVRLKMVGDKVYIEEWVEKSGSDGYKIIDEDGIMVTNNVTILHKEWVELKEEEPEKEEEELPKNIVSNNTTDEDTENCQNIIDDFIQNT